MQSLRTDFGDKCRDIDTAISEVRGQGHHTHEMTEGLQRTVDNRPTSISVSYTHLDVYKRQVLNCPGYPKWFRRLSVHFHSSFH